MKVAEIEALGEGFVGTDIRGAFDLVAEVRLRSPDDPSDKIAQFIRNRCTGRACFDRNNRRDAPTWKGWVAFSSMEDARLFRLTYA